MTRLALPSLRWMRAGLHQLDQGRIPSTLSISARTFRLSASSRRISSEKTASETSTQISRSSSACCPVDDDLVVGLHALDLQQHRLDLRGEDVDAADDQHVVGAAGDLLHADQRAAAGARSRGAGGDVARAVADDRQRLLGERREDQLAPLPVGQRLAGLRVDDLGEEVVLEDVQAALVRALLRRRRGR